MNFVSKITSLPNLLMNNFSSVFLASGEVTASFLDSDNLLTRLLRVVLQFFYFATKWLMYMIDVMYFYILQLVGVTTDTTIFDSSRTDPTFRMLIDNKEEVTTYIKNFAAIAILLIIITAIIAIIIKQTTSIILFHFFPTILTNTSTHILHTNKVHTVYSNCLNLDPKRFYASSSLPYQLKLQCLLLFCQGY